MFEDSPKHLSGKTKVVLLTILLVFTLVLGLGTYAAAKLKEPFKRGAQAQEIVIKKGTSTKQTAKLLSQKGITNSKLLFIYYVALKGASDEIQAGTYSLSASMTIPEIVEALTDGKVVPNEVRFTIIEGWDLSEIAQLVENHQLGTKDEFYSLAGSTPFAGNLPASETIVNQYDFLKDLPEGASLEGYLFPDTYFVSRENGVDELVHKSLRNFQKQITEKSVQAQYQNKTLHQIITMASLIEAEVGRNITGRSLTELEKADLENERKIVSDVFWSRLNIGMPLESDATISYATGISKRRASFVDLDIQSPYNTYRRKGLPPGPIGSPSMASIDAALNPADTEFLFFLSAPDGKSYFAKTLEEHKQNRQRYLD